MRPRQWRADTRSFIVAGTLLLIAIAWWSGLFPGKDAPVPGGFGTLFAIVATISLIVGIVNHRRIASQAHAARTIQPPNTEPQ